MRKLLSLTLAVLFAITLAAPVAAQQASPGSPVTQTGATGLAAQQCLTTGTAGSTTTQATLTVPSPGGGNSIYFDYLLATLNSVAAPASTSAPLMFTSTNIAGTPTWAGNIFGGAVSGGLALPVPGLTGPLGIPIKALVGTAPTVVGPSANATWGQTITACWHAAP